MLRLTPLCRRVENVASARGSQAILHAPKDVRDQMHWQTEDSGTAEVHPKELQQTAAGESVQTVGVDQVSSLAGSD